ncbi:MAG: nuclear transport factor 2 family protein [Acidobacteriota bacterium]
MKDLVMAFMLMLLSLPSSVLRAEESVSPDYETVKKTIEDSIGWALNKDFDRLFSIMANDENLFHFWLTSDSEVVGITAFRKHAEQWKDPEFKATRFEFKDLRITFSRSGDVAWYSCFLDDCGEYKGQPYCIENVFQTGVLEKRDGKWVHVQMHGSYPVDKIPESYVWRYYKGLFEQK